RPESDAGEDLGLTACEEGGTVDSRRDVDLALDRADLVLRAAVGPLAVDGDPLADHVLLELRERPLDRDLPLRIDLVALGGIRRQRVLLDLLDRVLAGELLGDLGRLVESLTVRDDDLLEQ